VRGVSHDKGKLSPRVSSMCPPRSPRPPRLRPYVVPAPRFFSAAPFVSARHFSESPRLRRVASRITTEIPLVVGAELAHSRDNFPSSGSLEEILRPLIAGKVRFYASYD